jgi:hypothetical protein
MKHTLTTLVILSALALSFSNSWADPRSLAASAALSRDPAAVQQSIATLRDAGPAGLAALLDQYDKSGDARLIPIIDAVAAQHDALSSRLYWYTDIAKATEAASAAHKPILYLRLLGKLTDEYSCANSRFFRTVLYANAEVSKFMREHYVLVWVSERPVPVVTIDYGDGRVLKRTITGNSIHYIVTSNGQVIDALPGLYDPKTFIAILAGAERLASTRALLPDALTKYLDEKATALRDAWQADVRRVAPKLLRVGLQPVPQAGQAPDARAAMRLAVSKSKVEAPLLAKITPRDFAAAVDRSFDAADDATWQKLALLHVADAALDASSIALIRSQNAEAYREAGALDKTLGKLQQTIALDTVRNNYQFRRRILSWLRESPGQVYVEDLNRRVYAELFLTPRTDPWLGLMPAGTYSALSGDGCVVDAKGH